MKNMMKKTIINVLGSVAIQIDKVIDEELEKNKMHIGFFSAASYDWEYPWVFDGPMNRPMEPLHDFVWTIFVFRGERRPLLDGEILHHKNRDKNDARISNLGPGTRAVHAKAHALERQRFTIRKRDHLAGLYRPHAPQAVKTLSEAEKSEIEKTLLERSREEDRERAAQEEWTAKVIKPSPPLDVENVLAGVFIRLRPLITALGKKIPPPSSRPQMSDRLLGVEKIRRGCTYGEAGLVLCLIAHEFVSEAVAAEVGLPVNIIETTMKTPAVSLAIENWNRHNRLPKPSSFEKLRPFDSKLKRPTAARQAVSHQDATRCPRAESK